MLTFSNKYYEYQRECDHMQVNTCIVKVLLYICIMEYSKKAIQILEAAKELFASRGFKAVTTKEIAVAAAVNEVTIFRQFENKEKLFGHVLKYSISKPDLKKYIDPEEKELGKYLTGIGRLMQFVFTENLEIFKIELFERGLTDKRKTITTLPNAIKDQMVEYLVSNHNMGKAEAEKYAISFMSSMHGLCLNVYFTKTFKLNSSFDDYFNLIIDRFK